MPSALEQLLRHPWPGNVRELKMLVERLNVCADGPVITVADIVAAISTFTPRPVDRTALEAALFAHAWDVAQTARALGVGRTTLYRWMQGLDVRRPAARTDR